MIFTRVWNRLEKERVEDAGLIFPNRKKRMIYRERNEHFRDNYYYYVLLPVILVATKFLTLSEAHQTRGKD